MTVLRRGGFALANALLASQGVTQPRPLRDCVGDTLQVRRDTTVTTTVDTIGPGLEYRCILDRRGPWAMHLVALDLRQRDLVVDGERALARFQGRERVSDMARRIAAQGVMPLIGINADFFDLRTGEVENNQVVSGEWVKGTIISDSPHGALDGAHTQFALDANGRPLIGRFSLSGFAIMGWRAERLVGINFRPAYGDGLVLYTPWHGERTLRDTVIRRDPAAPLPSVTQGRADSTRQAAGITARAAHEVVLDRVGQRQDTVLYRARRGRPLTGGGASIPPTGAVLSGIGELAAPFVDDLARRGGVVKVVHRLVATDVAPQVVVGGWPRVLAAGTDVGREADAREGTASRFSNARHPRSAIGISPDSTRLFLFVVDGRRPWSVGMTLSELADAMKAHGAWDAMNLDGGGSSALWVRGRVVNVPSDPAGERAVGNALWIVRP